MSNNSTDKPLSRADLHKLAADYGSEAAKELAHYLGFDHTSRLEQTPNEPDQSVVKTDDTAPQLAPLELKAPERVLRYWYVQAYRTLAKTPQDKRQDDNTSLTSEVMNVRLQQDIAGRLISEQQWQAFWMEFTDVPWSTQELDLEPAVESVARLCFDDLPTQTKTVDIEEIAVLVDFSDYLYPVIDELLEGLAYLQRRIGDDAVKVITIADSSELAGLALVDTIPTVLLSDKGRCSPDEKTRSQWQAFTNKWLEAPVHYADTRLFNSENLFEHRGKQHRGKQHRVKQLVAVLSHCFLPDKYRCRNIAWRLNASVSELVLAWNSEGAAITESNCWQPDSRHWREIRQALADEPYLGLSKDMIQTLFERDWPWIAEHRAALEQLSLFDIGLAEPPDIQPLEALRVDSSQPYTPKVGFWRASWPYLQQAETAKNHPSLQPVYEMAAKAVGNAALTAAPDKPVDHYQLQVTPKGLQVAETAQYPVIATVPSQLQDKRTGQQITTSSYWETGVVYLKNKDVEITLNCLTKPDWAERIWQEGNLIHAVHNSGAIYRLNPAGPAQDTVKEKSQWQCLHNPWPWAKATGIDDYGLWASFEIKGIRQTLRFIPPGEFIQGSPKDEPVRRRNEVQRHVTLTRGFWLADTACTQALWQAVMGENPSQFKGDDLPVEQVSWEDCQDFFNEINRLVPELGLTFPTEAQWEYACRAGTSTPFNWNSAELNSDLANFDGSRPYADNAKSEKRRCTVQVKHFTPNDWGLYQMHGNVNEWCADWYGSWQAEPAHDPTGPNGGSRRSLRGGGWFHGGHGLRSAARDHNSPSLRYYSLGLRVAAGIDPIAPQSAASRARQASDDK